MSWNKVANETYVITNLTPKLPVTRDPAILPDYRGRVPVRTIDGRWRLVNIKWLRKAEAK